MKAYKKIAKQGWNRDKKASNRKLRAYAEIEITEQLEEKSSVGKAGSKKPDKIHKHISIKLTQLRYIYKFAQRHANGNVEDLRFPDPVLKSEWVAGIRQDYYQRYKKLVPKVCEALKRDDLPNKLRKQIIEVLQLFNINSDE